MIRSIIVDDEELARAYLRRLLQAHDDVRIAGEASSGIEALESIAELQPDIVFLDIEMPALNAFA